MKDTFLLLILCRLDQNKKESPSKRPELPSHSQLVRPFNGAALVLPILSTSSTSGATFLFALLPLPSLPLFFFLLSSLFTTVSCPQSLFSCSLSLHLNRLFFFSLLSLFSLSLLHTHTHPHFPPIHRIPDQPTKSSLLTSGPIF